MSSNRKRVCSHTAQGDVQHLVNRLKSITLAVCWRLGLEHLDRPRDGGQRKGSCVEFQRVENRRAFTLFWAPIVRKRALNVRLPPLEYRIHARFYTRFHRVCCQRPRGGFGGLRGGFRAGGGGVRVWGGFGGVRGVL